MGNVEYAGAFAELVLPVLHSFDPDLILIASGLDAAKGDLLGDCGLTPEMYYIMTESLLEEVGGHIPVVSVLEGGYNLGVISKCMQAVALALLDEPYDEAESSKLSRFWTHAMMAGQHEGKKPKKATLSAIKSIKKSTRALVRAGLSDHSASIYNARPPTPATRDLEPVTEFNKRYRRLSLRDSDRYPVKKRMMLRVVEDGYFSA